MASSPEASPVPAGTEAMHRWKETGNRLMRGYSLILGLQQWLQEGLSFEAHTLGHPCPILAQGNFTNAQNTCHG